jgi:hypothetical protein
VPLFRVATNAFVTKEHKKEGCRNTYSTTCTFTYPRLLTICHHVTLKIIWNVGFNAQLHSTHVSELFLYPWINSCIWIFGILIILKLELFISILGAGRLNSSVRMMPCASKLVGEANQRN